MAEVHEESVMCKPNDLGETIHTVSNRLTSILLTYEDVSLKTSEIVLSGVDAFCIQHLVDVLNGWWPCK